MRGKRADADEGSARPNAADFNFATLRGEIRRVTFHNADNFYTVARVRVAAADVASLPVGATAVPGGGEGSKYGKYKKRGRGGKGDASAREATVTVVGHIPGAAEGTNLLMTGDWRDVEWGTQFVLNCAPRVAPAGPDAMLRYLAGGALPASGNAAKLVAHFGVDVFAAFDAPDAERRLRECPGVGAKTAAKLAGAWGDSRGRRDALFLEKHGVAPALAQRVAAAHAPGPARVRADLGARRDPRRDVPPVRRVRRVEGGEHVDAEVRHQLGGGHAARAAAGGGGRRARLRAVCETGGRRRQAGGPAAVPGP